jgi:indole-3-glycerol phosphate synthase
MLHKIVEEKKKEILRLKETTDLKEWEKKLANLAQTRPFAGRLTNSERKVSVIAEVKKASPSKGLIRPDFHPLEIATAYRNAQVDAMSVLTDEPFFQGSKQYLTAIREQFDIPLLRKDFILDPLQVYEARLIGADCILLIAAILNKEQLVGLSKLARDLGMDSLIEVHNLEELDFVLSHVQPEILGINNRNLKTFETHLSVTEQLMPSVPVQLPVVSESGIHSAEDIQFLEELGVRAVLVGEYFMRQNDIPQAVRELVG